MRIVVLLLAFVSWSAGAFDFILFGPNAKTSFEASLTHSLVPEKSIISTPTYSRTTTATVTDFEGLVKTVKSGEARFTGARRVENLVSTKSEDWTNAAWTKTIGTVTATTLTATGANQTVLQTYTGTGTFVMRVEMSRITGTGNIDLTLNGGTNWTTVTLTGSNQVFSISGTGLTNPQFGIRIVTSGDSINATKIQLQNTTGQTITTSPDEYVSVGVLSFPYHGAGADGVKYFPYQNGNTVASNVVTEAQGAAISGIRGYLSEEQRTNLLLRSEEFDNASWVKSGVTVSANSVVAPNGTTTADTITEDTGNSVHIAYQSISKSTSALVYSYTVRIKNITGSRNLIVGLNRGSSGVGVNFNPENGTINASGTAGTGFTLTSATVESIYGGFYKVKLIGTSNTGTNIDATVRMTNSSTDVLTTSYMGDGTSAVAIWGVQLEQASSASSYIPTTTATVTRNADSLSYDLANMNNAMGAVYSEIQVDWTGSPASNATIIGNGSNPLLYIGTGDTTDDITVSDQTNTATKSNIDDAATGIRKRGALWNPAGINAVGNGLYVSGLFDGSMNATSLQIGVAGTGSRLNGTIKNVKVYNKAPKVDKFARLTQ